VPTGLGNTSVIASPSRKIAAESTTRVPFRHGINFDKDMKIAGYRPATIKKRAPQL
jgi:hypothetical protein